MLIIKSLALSEIRNLKSDMYIILILSDNGKGFDPDVVAKKDESGLDTLQRRAKSSCTTLTCTSTLNNGTYYKLLIPEL
jgi:signal transduction histidine kinase